MSRPRSAPLIPESLFSAARERISANQRLRRSLPRWGRLHVDRQVPYLIVYRRPVRPDAGTDLLAKGHASYLAAATDLPLRRPVRALATTVAESLAGVFGACLVIEIWSAPADPDPAGAAPRFRVVAGHHPEDGDYLSRLVRELRRIRPAHREAEITINRGRPAPPGLLPLLTPGQAAAIGVHLIGLEVPAVYQTPNGTAEYPEARKALQRDLGRALGRTIFQFSRERTVFRPPTYHSLGRRAVVKAVWQTDRALSEVSGSFDLLLLVSPTDTDAAWSAFRRTRYQREPEFRYRPLPVDPATLKRRLWAIRVDRVEDPTLEFLFGEQRTYLDRQISLLSDRHTPAFLHGSLALYGEVGASLRTLAAEILEQIPPRREGGGRARSVSAEEFAATADAELERYRASAPDLQSRVELRDDVSSLMVSRGHLLVGSGMQFPARRVNALIQHEVGTHAVTHYNGSQQPLRLLASGLAGYEALQEGLAVLAEYLSGGLSPARLRTLAARVLAVDATARNASFVETYQLLTNDHGLGKRAAFLIAARVQRSGGFVKDAIYLRGLSEVLKHLADGGDPEVLTSGKFSLVHLPIVVELQRRRILKPPALRPRYLDGSETQKRLDRCRSGLTARALAEEVMK